MAWISVDQSLIGDRLRLLHKTIGCSRNEAIGILVNLWLWAIDKTDDTGELLAIDMNDIAEQLTIGMSKDLDPEQVTSHLKECGFIECDGDIVRILDLQMVGESFLKSEKKKNSHTEYMRVYRNRKKGSANKENVSEVHNEYHSESHGDIHKEKPKKQKAESRYGEDFEKLWSVYPRKDRKSEAFKAYLARIKEGHSPDTMFLAAQNYSNECAREKREQRYTLMGKTFLGPNLVFRDHVPSNPETMTRKETIEQKIKNGQNPFL